MSSTERKSEARPKNKVSSYLPIQTAMDNMAIEDNRMIPVFQGWVAEADEKIGSFYSYEKKIKVLDVSDCKVELPCDVVAVMAIIIGDHGCECDTKFDNFYSSVDDFTSVNVNVNGVGFAVVDGGGGLNSLGNHPTYVIQGNNLVFDHKLNQGKVTVQYLGYILDDDGFIMVNDTHVDAIAQYIEMKQALRSRWTPSKEISINETAIREMTKEWHRKCRHARAEDAKPSESELLEIKNLVNDPLSGVGMAMWRYNDTYFGNYYGG